MKKIRRTEVTRRMLEAAEQRKHVEENPEMPWRIEPRAPVRVV